MNKETTFICYSRSDDSAFVLMLAKDLRDAGINIWMDQLNIKAGSHWDNEIETALINAHSMIVILTPNSVASNNVKDEVSFALENGKKIIPVFLKKCNVPLRLQRLQRIDFTSNYSTALSNLLEVLGNDSVISSNENINSSEFRDNTPINNFRFAITPAQVDFSDEKKEEKTEAFKSETKGNSYTISNDSNKKNNIIKYVIIASTSLLLIICIGYLRNKKIEANTLDNTTGQNNAMLQEAQTNPFLLGKQFDGGTIFFVDNTGQHGLIVNNEDLGNMNQNDAKVICSRLGKGWNLPTKQELDLLYQSSNKIGLNSGNTYWSSSEYEYLKMCVYTKNFSNGTQGQSYLYNINNCRAIKAF